MKKKRKKFKPMSMKPGSIPGSLTYIGREVKEKTKVHACVYDETEVKRMNVHRLDSLGNLDRQEKLTWIDVDGVHDIAVVDELGKTFNLHPLLLEDVLNTTQKPKIEFYEEENQLFVVLKMMHFDQENLEVDSEQISMVLGRNFVLSFQELDDTDIFETIHGRLDNPASRIRRYKSDYLLYALIDLIVDYYFLLIDRLNGHLEDLEESVLDDPQTEHQNKIYRLKKEMSYMRRNVLPLRDMIQALIREDSDLVGKQVNVYLRDVLDHVVQILETLDACRDLADNIMNNYYASISNKTNEVMKTLTVFTVIFMPLSFIAGLYGMNFVNMPELQNPHGYFYTLGVMAVIAISLWFYFKWRDFL
ncbi:magnesium/cobalt transporter CorA [Marinilongibacter aquaticus]|uniref:magnesium/cobalt transporter CorA n=1 Tax=Marinilongibacter aquaticus TaxID=2975157 RepID=UPI0021BD8A31|nr:magnesium/cobalt transporter CorA [Marinilongibacter aquaticus]UBM59009.1 magnesium/cobalt transporter CorA [Marinilongibacter aquaticus]